MKGFLSSFFILAFLIVGCGTFKEPIIKKSDDFKLTQFEGKKISFTLSIEIENTNWYALKIKPSSVDLYLDEKTIGKLFLTEKVKIPANKASLITVPARIDLADGALFSLFKLVAKSDVNLRLNGKVKGGVFLVYKNFSVDEKWKIPTSFLKFDQLKLGGTFGLEK